MAKDNQPSRRSQMLRMDLLYECSELDEQLALQAENGRLRAVNGKLVAAMDNSYTALTEHRLSPEEIGDVAAGMFVALAEYYGHPESKETA